MPQVNQLPVLLLSVTTFLVFQVSADVQSVRICYENCTDDSEIIRSNNRNVTQITPKGKKVSKICSINSSWTVFEKPNFEGKSQDLSGSSCVSGHDVLSFRHHGNLETHKPGISLYDRYTFEGRELYFEGDGLQLLEPFNATSHCFTGIDRWELYQGPQFNGEAKCLQIRESTSYEYPRCENGLGVYDTFTDVQSIAKGCYHDRGRQDVHPRDPQRPKANIKSAPYLTLFTEKSQTGKQLHMDGTVVLRLPTTYKFESFRFKSSWQLFTLIDFDGNTTCLDSTTQPLYSTGNGGYTHGNASLEVGSIKRGCGHAVNEIKEIQYKVSGSPDSKPWIGQFILLLVIYQF